MPAEDVALVATFAADQVGIDGTPDGSITLYVVNDRLVVRGAQKETIRVFDVIGRLIAQRNDAAEVESIQLTNTGVYMVKVGNRPARRVVVRR